MGRAAVMVPRAVGIRVQLSGSKVAGLLFAARREHDARTGLEPAQARQASGTRTRGLRYGPPAAGTSASYPEGRRGLPVKCPGQTT